MGSSVEEEPAPVADSRAGNRRDAECTAAQRSAGQAPEHHVKSPDVSPSCEYSPLQARQSSGAVCNRCVHFFVTYDVNFPYGCRAMNFKSRQLPNREVLAVTGEACVSFIAKPPIRRAPAR
jgi:hypothetical protein